MDTDERRWKFKIIPLYPRSSAFICVHLRFDSSKFFGLYDETDSVGRRRASRSLISCRRKKSNCSTVRCGSLLGESAGDSFRALVGAGEDADPAEVFLTGDALNAGGDPIRLSSGVFRMKVIRRHVVRE